MADPDLEIRRGGGSSLQKIFFSPLDSVCSKDRGGAPLDPPLYISSNIVDLNMINPTLPAQPPFVFPLIEEGDKQAWVKPLKLPQPKLLDYSILFSLDKLVFDCKHPFIKTDGHNCETAVLSIHSYYSWLQNFILAMEAVYALQSSYSTHAESFSTLPKLGTLLAG